MIGFALGFALGHAIHHAQIDHRAAIAEQKARARYAIVQKVK